MSAWFHTVFESVNCLSTERYKLICTVGQVKFSLDKYIMAIYLSLDKEKILLFPHPCLSFLPEDMLGPLATNRVPIKDSDQPAQILLPAPFTHYFVSGMQSFYLSYSQDAIELQTCHEK